MPDIRACVLTADYRTAYTWLADGSIWRFHRDTREAVLLDDTAHSQVAFNAFLKTMGVLPILTRWEIRELRDSRRLAKLVMEKDDGPVEVF